MQDDREVKSYQVFFEKDRAEYDEWEKKDLVLDPDEDWKEWFVRNMNFKEPARIPREELDDGKQPHQTFYWRMASYMSGVNPYPPGHKKNPRRTRTVEIEKENMDPVESDRQMSPEEEKEDYQVKKVELSDEGEPEELDAEE